MSTLRWSDLEPRFLALVERPVTAAAVPTLLQDLDALEREVREAYAGRMRAKDEDTADEAAKQAFLDFVQDVMPRLEPIEDRLNRKLLDVSGYRSPPELEVAWADMRDTVELFRDENVARNVEEQGLQQRYGEIAGRTRVVLNGEETTVARARAELEVPDRAAREAAWRALEKGKAAQQPQLDDLFLEMVRLRGQIATAAGLTDYRAFAWKARHRREYTAQDALELHAAVAAEIVPRLRTLDQRRRERLGVARLRPWDLSADPNGREPLRPFGDVAELDAGLQRMFMALDPELGEAYQLLQGGWMDLEPRPNKVPGSATSRTFRSRAGRTSIGARWVPTMTC